MVGNILKMKLFRILLSTYTFTQVLRVKVPWFDSIFVNIIFFFFFDNLLTIYPIVSDLIVFNSYRLLGPNSTKEERDKYLNSIFAMSLMRYPFYDQPVVYLDSVNNSFTPLNRSEISNIMLKVKLLGALLKFNPKSLPTSVSR